MFANFVSDGTTLTDENGTQFRLRFQEIGLKALSKWDEYKNIEIEYDKLKEAGKEPDVFYWIHQEEFLKNIPINESNYALFAKALDENLALYNKLMQLKVNRMIIIIFIKHFHLDSILTSALQATVFKLMAMRLSGHELSLLKLVILL